MKILLFANTDWYLYNFRLPLAVALQGKGHEVILVSPPGAYGEKLVAAGFRWVPFAFARKGVNPGAELLTLMRLISLYRVERPDIAHHFTVKCMLYGGIAAQFTQTRCIAAVTGLGHVFTTNSLKTRLIRPLVSLLYRIVLRSANVIFQNPDDRDAFITRGLVDPANCQLIRGSGVNTDRFVPRTPVSMESQRVVMVARLLMEKGIQEFAHAAVLVKARLPNAKLVLAGDPDPGNPSSVSDADLNAWRRNSPVEFLGHVEDILTLLQAATICVLPSYREGTPRSLVEAAACGLPLVATDVPGCREIVRDGINGLLVPPKDAASLANAIIQLLEDAATRNRMGARSREIAVAEFSERRVIEETLRVYEIAMQR